MQIPNIQVSTEPKINLSNAKAGKKSFSVSFRHKKIPRYIYHFTGQSQYESMLKDGYIRAKDNDYYLRTPAIFAVDLQMFLKNWGINKAWNNKYQSEPSISIFDYEGCDFKRAFCGLVK